jgi:streptogramin lyase
MKRLGLWAGVAMALFLVVGFSDVNQDKAAGKKHTTCTVATLKGRYLFADAGMLLPPAAGVTVATPGADAGFNVFNGDGTGTDTVTVRLNGVIQFHNLVVPTIYTLNPDCTGTITVNVPGGGGPTFDIFVAPDGAAISVIATNPGNYPSRIVRRVASE